MVNASSSVELLRYDRTRVGTAARTVLLHPTDDLDLEITRVIGATHPRASSSGETTPRDKARPAGTPFEIDGYRLVRELGRGGMGIVYEARLASARKSVAVKTIC